MPSFRPSVLPFVLPSFRPSVLPSVRPSHFVSGAEHKNRERYLNQTWYIDRSSGELVPFDSLGFFWDFFGGFFWDLGFFGGIFFCFFFKFFKGAF